MGTERYSYRWYCGWSQVRIFFKYNINIMHVMSLLYRRPSGKGNRLIILHAGSENGWLPHAQEIIMMK